MTCDFSEVPLWEEISLTRGWVRASEKKVFTTKPPRAQTTQSMILCRGERNILQKENEPSNNVAVSIYSSIISDTSGISALNHITNISFRLQYISDRMKFPTQVGTTETSVFFPPFRQTRLRCRTWGEDYHCKFEWKDHPSQLTDDAFPSAAPETIGFFCKGTLHSSNCSLKHFLTVQVLQGHLGRIPMNSFQMIDIILTASSSSAELLLNLPLRSSQGRETAIHPTPTNLMPVLARDAQNQGGIAEARSSFSGSLPSGASHVEGDIMKGQSSTRDETGSRTEVTVVFRSKPVLARNDSGPDKQCELGPALPEPLLRERVSRVVKELWVSALLRPPQGVQGARVTQLPSIKLVLKELGGRHAGMTVDAGSLEKLLQRQAQAGAKQLPVPVPSSSEGGRGHVGGTLAAVGALGPSGPASAGALFGRPLADLCSPDGMLPQPIQDLLALLKEHGPSTEGIFRLSASERASREVREALDSGVPVQLENHPVLLLAVLLKDLLRKIPSKLLDVQLYEAWMRAMEKTSRQERLAALRENDSGPDKQCELGPALPEPLLRERVRVLSSGKGSAGDAAEEEEGKATSSLVFLWPCGSCVVTFCSRVVKELWVSALLRPPQGVQGARVTQLPSIKLVLKELGGRHAGMTVDAGSLEKLLQRQAQAGAKQLPVPVPSSSEGGRGHVGGECGEDTDLLALLKEHGPSTEGIFRLSASERASRESSVCTVDLGPPGPVSRKTVAAAALTFHWWTLQLNDSGPDKQCELGPALPEPLLRERVRVLSSGKGSAGDAAEEEEGKATSSLVFLWPCGSCVVTFCSRVVKELWVSALLRPPQGVQGARVTQLPSIKLVLKELGGRHAGMTVDAGSLEKLLQRQAQAGAKQLPVPVPSSSEGGRGHVGGTLAAVGALGPSGPASAGALFGRPLADLCSPDGMLPQPIQDLLALLKEHGPSTEGIFRLSASERASREVREALDSGVPVQLENHPVLLLAVLLKDLLRKIPSKLLDVQLYEAWMRAMEKTSRQERLAALRENDSGPDKQCELGPALPEPLLRERVRVLSSGKGSAGDAAEEEEGKATSSLVFLWPCGSCVVTFCSRVVKELWVSALLRPPQGVQGARVTQLPSIKLVLKELGGRHAGMTVDAGSLEKLLQRQAQAGAKQLPVPVPSSSEGGRGHVGGECGEDTDLLALLKEHGPSTEGIFRLSASERASREYQSPKSLGHLAIPQTLFGRENDSGPDKQCELGPALPEPLLRERVRVLSSGKGSAGDAAEEEEGKATSSLVFLWPCGSCVVTFCSRVVKELWVSALLRPPQGVQGARVTQLPSIKLVLKELGGRHAGMTVDAGSLEKLLQRQAQAGAKQLPVPVPSSSEGGRGHVGGECGEDTDLLALLKEHGPSTEGIFRLSASERASREPGGPIASWGVASRSRLTILPLYLTLVK
ncbi:uncharacterized protein ACIB01_004755 [Guaruba guarouba]